MEIVDVPMNLLTIEQDSVINMMIRLKLDELMAKTDPEVYRKYLVMEKGVIVLYVNLLKAIYMCLRSTLMFYTNFLLTQNQ